MPVTASDNTIAAQEQSARELNEIRKLKTDLEKFFTDYQVSRSGVLNYLTRNRELTKEKLALVKDTIGFIQEFKGTKEELVSGLRAFRVTNATLSTAKNKFHTNLLGDVTEDKEASDKAQNRGYQGKSALADAFNSAIKMAEGFGLNEIRNTL